VLQIWYHEVPLSINWSLLFLNYGRGVLIITARLCILIEFTCIL